MIRRVLRDNWPLDKAEEEAKKIGLKESPHLNEFVRNYIARHRNKAASTERELVEIELELSDALSKGDNQRLAHFDPVVTLPDGKVSSRVLLPRR